MQRTPPPITHLVFLDFDGVLHPTNAAAGDRFDRADALAACLEGRRGCGVVVSSSWRHHHAMSELLSRLPAGIASRVVGATGEPHVGRWPRHKEITNYLRVCAPGRPWRALDDSLLEFPPGCPELIHCDPNVGFGLAQDHALRAWLRGFA